jgi:RNA polymerase sigma-70 factor, ECF subfamily
LQFTAFDALYLERLRAGDAATERHFADYFGELIHLKLRTRLSAKEAIEDVRQETFARMLALIRVEGGVKQPERLGALVNSVCNNVLLEHYRSRRGQQTSLDEEDEGRLVAPEPAAPTLLEIQDTERIVRHTLSQLPDRDRQLLQMVLLEERDKDEVCAEIGVTRDYLRVLVHRAKDSFKSFYFRRLRAGS